MVVKGCITITMILIFKAPQTNCLRLTNMTAPVVQDPRHDMHLHCRFDMGGEELYAVKWYKDDHEFFRYTPENSEKMVGFPVPGVHVDPELSSCDKSSCDLLLKDVTRPQSSGAYRCEVSSEAPAFRLASQTHNITVAALPEYPPTLDGLENSYLVGDLLMATCTSDLGDPKPTLTFYINKKPISKNMVKELSADPSYHHPTKELSLTKSRIQVRLPLEKKIITVHQSSSLEITCVSTTKGIRSSSIQPLSTHRNFSIIDPNQVVNNQKYRWADPSSSQNCNQNSLLLIFFSYICILSTIVKKQ